MDTRINTAMQCQMQLYLQNPEIPGTKAQHHPKETPITLLSIPIYHLMKKKGGKDNERATTIVRYNTTLAIVSSRKKTGTIIGTEEMWEEEEHKEGVDPAASTIPRKNQTTLSESPTPPTIQELLLAEIDYS